MIGQGSSRRRACWALTLAACACWIALNLDRTRTVPRHDMVSYVEGARAVAGGESPYGTGKGYYYPPLLAIALAPFAGLGDPELALAGDLLIAVSSALLVISVLAAAGLGGTPWGVLGALILFLPLFSDGLVFGNISVVVAAMLSVAFLLFRRFPVAAGVLLAFATHLKVLPGLLVAYLLFAGWSRRDGAALRAALTATLLGTAALALPWTGDYLALVLSGGMQDAKLACGSNFSVVAYFHSVGVPLPSAVPVAFALACAWLLARKGPGDDLVEWSVAHCLVVLSSPIVWFHTYTMALLPVAVFAARALRGFRLVWSGGRSARLLDSLLPLAALAVVTDAEHYYIRSWAGRFLSPLLPVLLPVALALALLAQHKPDGDRVNL